MRYNHRSVENAVVFAFSLFQGGDASDNDLVCVVTALNFSFFLPIVILISVQHFVSYCLDTVSIFLSIWDLKQVWAAEVRARLHRGILILLIHNRAQDGQCKKESRCLSKVC